MLASSFYDLVLGVDIHYEILPTSPTPVPIPNPFIGLVYDPLGLIVGLAIDAAISFVLGAPFQGPVVYWSAFPATNTGTEAIHVTGHILIPPGIQWAPFPKTPKPVIRPGEALVPGPPVQPENDAVMITGSKTVTVMGTNAVRLGDIALSCSEPLRLPSSTVLAVPKGSPILIGGPPSLDLEAAAGASLRTRFVSDSLHALISRIKPKRLRNFLHRTVCFFTGHPVDVATGKVMTEFVDVDLSGPLPLRIERIYSSAFASRPGPVGHGWSISCDQAVWRERGKVVLLAEDGREIEFDTFDLPRHRIEPGQSVYDPIARLSLHCEDDGSWRIVADDGTSRFFGPVPGRSDGRAMLLRVRSRCGYHEVVYQYDRRGRLERIRDSGGRILSLWYDAEDRLSELHLPRPHGEGFYRHRRYVYGEEGDLVEVIDSLGHAWKFAYVTHLLTQETDRNGLSFYFAYDGVGEDAWCVRTWGDGGIYDHVLAYDKARRATFVTDSLGHTTQYHMNPIGQVVKIVDPKASEWKFEYDGITRQRAKFTDPLGAAVERGLDERGRTVWTRDAVGAEKRFIYEGSSLVRAQASPGAAWTMRYSPRGELTYAAASTGETWIWERNDGQVTRRIEPGGRDHAYEYDSRGNLVGERSGAGAAWRYEVDNWGRVKVIVDARGAVVRRRWDSENRLCEVVSPVGVVQRYEYDPEGNMLQASDATRKLGFRYGGRNRIIAREEAGAVVRFDYDSEGRLVAIRQPSGARSRFEWDPCGRLVHEVGRDGHEIFFTRDKAGRVRVRRTSVGTRKLEYDAMGRLVAARNDDGTMLSLAWRADGFIEEATRDGVTVRLERDALGRIVRESSQGVDVASRFGADGRREQMESSYGARASVERDATGAVRAMEMTRAGNPTSMRVVIERDEMGRERRRKLFGGVSVDTERDVAGRPRTRTIRTSDLRGAILVDQSETFEWRGDDQIVSITGDAGGERRFQHDAAGRVVVERRDDAVNLRKYDVDGNVYRDAEAGGRRYTPGGALVEAETGDYLVDPAGRRVSRDGREGEQWRYVWDGFGGLREVVRPDRRMVRFEYDAFARRTHKMVIHIDEHGVEAVERSVRYVWDGPVLLHEIANDGMTTWHWEPGTRRPIAREKGGEWWSIVHDLTGAPTRMYAASGSLVWCSRLDVWGRTVPLAGEAAASPWRFPGQYADPETNLVYNRFRYYDPETGQYLSPDPLRTVVGSVYGYPADPVLWVDPDGLEAAHHTVPVQLVKEMQKQGLLDGELDLKAFASTSRNGLAGLDDTAGRHAHSQAHQALSDYINSEHGLSLRRGFQHGADWSSYVDNMGSGQVILADLDNFYENWLPANIGEYPLLTNEGEKLQGAFKEDKDTLSDHCPT